MIGPAPFKLYNTFSLDNVDDQQKVEVILTKYEAYSIPRTNVI